MSYRIDDAKETPQEKANRLGVDLNEVAPKTTGVCSHCGRTLYDNNSCNCNSKNPNRL